MMLRRRVAATCLLVAVPAAAILTLAVDRARMRDLEVALDRVVRSQVNDQVRERCISDPNWFLTGPLIGRPANGMFVETSPDQLAPRPKLTGQGFELFAYDEAFTPTSVAGPRFPTEFRNELRASSDAAPMASYSTADGTGVQMAIATKAIATPCMYFLGRMAPPAHQMRTRVLTFLGFFVMCAVVAYLSAVPTIGRIRHLASVLRAAIASGYTSIAPEKRKDELSALTFMYNDTFDEMTLRKARIGDLDEALKRFTTATEAEVARPLAALEARLGELEIDGRASRDDVRGVFRQAHDLGAQIENLAAVSRLKSASVSPTHLNLNQIVERVVSRHRAFAHAGDVTLEVSLPSPAITTDADEVLVERALANVVDNAIRYTQPGGSVSVSLTRSTADARFRLFVKDTGRGVSDEQFRGLTAVRRFRGDEGRNRRPGAPGLGLAVAQEVIDRSNMKLDLSRPSGGGFQVEISGAA